MEMLESSLDGIPLIVIDGELDHSSKRAVLDALTEMFHGAYPPTNLLVDLTDCAFLDSGGLSVLLSALAQLRSPGWLGIVGASAGTNRVLEYTGFLDHENVRFFSSLSDAAGSLARERKLENPAKPRKPKKAPQAGQLPQAGAPRKAGQQ